jgi:hypothetical protein
MAPVMAKLWTQKETWDGTYDLTDLLDIREAMMVESENKRRAQESAEREAKNR